MTSSLRYGAILVAVTFLAVAWSNTPLAATYVAAADRHEPLPGARESCNRTATLWGRMTESSGRARSIRFELYADVNAPNDCAVNARPKYAFDSRKTYRTADDGSFTVRGLPSDWRGWIKIVDFGVDIVGARLMGRPTTFPTVFLPVTVAASGIEITLRRHPILRAEPRPASPEDPANGWSLVLRTIYGGEQTINRGGSAIGRPFQFSLGPIPFDSISLDFYSFRAKVSGERAARHFEIDGPHVGDIDLGTVDLLPARRIGLRIVDSKGRAVPTAAVSRPEPLDSIGAPRVIAVDGKGRCSFFARGGECTAFVEAEGFRRRAVLIPEQNPESIDVPLEETTLLTVKVVTSDGSIPSFINVRLRAVDDGEPLSEKVEQVRDSRDDVSMWEEEGFISKVSKSGVIPFCGLPAHRPLVLEVVEPWGLPLVSAPITLIERERREVVFRLEMPEKTVTGIVRDESGAPIEHAVVTLNGKESDHPTDARGGFEIVGTFIRHGRLEVERSGYIPIVVDGFVFPDDGSKVEITLERGRPLTVHVVDGDGRPYRPAWYLLDDASPVTVEAPADSGRIRYPPPLRRYGRPSDSDPVPETYEFRGLPEGEVVIRWRDALGRVSELRHDVKEPVVTVKCPRHGALKVGIGPPLSMAHEYRVALRPIDSAVATIFRSSLRERVFFSRDWDWLGEVCVFEALVAGTYEAALERRDEIPNGKQTISSWREVSKRSIVRIEAGEEKLVVLENFD